MHSIRQAACRLLASPASAPVRSTWTRSSTSAVHHTTRFAVLRQTNPSIIQSRWNSQDAQRPAAQPQSTTPLPDSNEDSTARQAEDAPKPTTAETHHEIQPEKKPRDELDPRDRSSSGDPYFDAVSFEASHEDETLDDEVYPRNSRHMEMFRKLKRMTEPKETVFVGNIFFDVTAEDVQQRMQKFGVVEQVYIVRDNRGISKGFGYVQFDTVEAAARAIQGMHLKVFEGRRATVEFAQNNVNTHMGIRNPSRTLYLGNVPFDVTDKDLGELFEGIANVVDVRVAIDRRTGLAKGFAHADFLDIESAKVGLELLRQRRPHGRRLRVDFSHSSRLANTVDK
ncbi:nucleic acid-binding protein [Aspergillus candidus]|uniref:RNA-binding domain-containing protein n=1 Tax=Aspergillus candidus TaxID=41067 RepID=A0A2I2F968_ASPCN|nr:RNA-binding domain-containing protein [Aspergillus candidus]PLB37186.1 RNA-binding domain-containing protein [Aspergillus candidus]